MTQIIFTIILISLIFAPLGCISLWKKYVYFSDGLAHASLLAGNIAIILHLPMIYSGLIVSILFPMLIFILKNTSSNNAIISLVSSVMLSVALIMNYMNPLQLHINNLLFGDILSVSLNDLVILLVILALVTCFIWSFYNQIILIIINRDIAQIKGIKVKTIELAFLVLLSLSVFLTIQIVGALLVTAILLMPAMIARSISSTPMSMIINSVILALIINNLGLATSFLLDMPIAPIIIIISTIIYCIFCMISYFRNTKLRLKLYNHERSHSSK